VELYNPTGSVVDLSGWWLSDDPANLQKYQLISGTMIAAGGYRVLLGDNDGDPANNAALPAQYFGRAFLLSSAGEELVLSSPDLSYSHAVTFPTSENGVSLGRYLTSQGAEHFPPQKSVTLGGVNAGPRVGPVVISEIHYNPASGGHEFVELSTISDQSVTLSGNGGAWEVSGIGFTFPVGTILPPAGQILLVRDTTTAAAFRSAHSVPADVPIFIYTGALDNGGERLRLEKPLDPDPITAEILRVGVDELRYDDDAPWPPGPDGTGSSLERINLSSYADDVINWRASVLPGGSPGREAGRIGRSVQLSGQRLDGTPLALEPQILPSAGQRVILPGTIYRFNGLLPGSTYQFNLEIPPPVVPHGAG